jgi:hypothetical protein
MDYQNELTATRRTDILDGIKYTHWIVGGVVTLAIVIAAAAFISTGNTPDRLPALASSALMTGSDTAPPAPANR